MISSNKNRYCNSRAPIAAAIIIIAILVMLSGAFGQIEDDESAGMGDEGAIFESIPNQIGLAGSWNLNFTGLDVNSLNLTLSEVGQYIFGSGILVYGNKSQQITAVGWKEEECYHLYMVMSDGNEMIDIQLKEEGGIVSGEYESYYIGGNTSMGEIQGSRIIEKVGTEWGPFGVSIESSGNTSMGEIQGSKTIEKEMKPIPRLMPPWMPFGVNKNEEDHESTDSSTDDSSEDNSAEGTADLKKDSPDKANSKND